MDTTFERKVYICQNKNNDIRFDSTSGGVFSALAQYVINRQGYVFGAEFDECWNVIHGYGQTYDDLKRFRGSKYVQSHMGDTFNEVKHLLEDDNWILFSGTPCQVAALKKKVAISEVDEKKLILVDIVCHGTPKAVVWNDFKEWLMKYD